MSYMTELPFALWEVLFPFKYSLDVSEESLLRIRNNTVLEKRLIVNLCWWCYRESSHPPHELPYRGIKSCPNE